MEVCRVCLDLQHHGSFDPLDGVLRDMVGLLSPEMNMDISDNPVICKTCSLPLDELFNFKTNFLKNEDQIEGKIDKNKGPLDLRDILKGTETIVNQIKAKEKFCRTCLELIDCDSYTVIDPEQPNIYVNCMLNLCLPEMDIELTKNPIMCESCLEKLQKLHHFKSTCLETEKKLNNHCEIFGTNSSGQINLVNVLDSNLAKKSDVIPEIHNSNFLAVQTGELVVRNGLVITKVEASNGDANNDKIKIEDNSDVNEDTKANIELNTKKHEDNVDIEEIIIKQEIKKEMEIEDEKADEYDVLATSKGEVGEKKKNEKPMPKYTRKTNKASWDADKMRKAILFVANGGAIREAGRKFEIPESTIRKRKKNYDEGRDIEGPQRGRYPVFSQKQEKDLTSHILKMAKLFYGVSITQLRRLAYSYALANNIPNNFNAATKMAGKDWYYQFLKRNNEMSLEKPEPISINRISAFNEVHVNQFFEKLKELYEKFHFTDDKIFNVDETGISTVQKPCKRLGPKGVKQFGAKTSSEMEKTVTVICCFNAAGTCYVPPMFIFPKARTTNTLEKTGQPHSKYSCSKSGWSNEQLFYQWLQHFNEIVKPSKDQPVLVILDNHSSHISVEIYEFCIQNGIELLIIPPHASHRLQPLDLTFYGPLKTAFNRQCDNYLLNFKRIMPYDLTELFHKAYSHVATMDKAKSGFKTAGIWPFQPDQITKEDFLPSSHHMPVVEIYEDHENDSDMQTEGPGTSNSEVCQQIKSESPSTSKMQRTKKQKSDILTETPNLEKKLIQKLSVKAKASATHLAKDKKTVKRKVFEESDSKEISDSQLCDDDELDETEDNTEDKCLVCDDWSKKDEYWFKCSVCGRWAHELCSGADSPEVYICDFCDH